MISNEFKQLAKAIVSSGMMDNFPYSVLIDKVTGEPKNTPKNMVLFNIVQQMMKMPEAERITLSYHRVTPEMIDYFKTLTDRPVYPASILDSVYRIGKDYISKMKVLSAKKDREAKKLAVASAKQQLTNSLDRKDIAATISKIIASIEPYIVKSEATIEQQLKDKEKKFEADWNTTMQMLKKEGASFSFAGNPEDVSFRKAYDIMRAGRINVNGKNEYFDGYATIGRWPLSNWMDYKTGGPVQFIRLIQRPNDLELLASQMKKQFRDSQIHKVNVLFHRLMKSNPSLRGYEMTKKYNGNEFTLEAQNDKNEKIIIQTNTILAGGYNIQRLHARWLVSVKNSATGKTEKFTIEDKDKA